MFLLNPESTLYRIKTERSRNRKLYWTHGIRSQPRGVVALTHTLKCSFFINFFNVYCFVKCRVITLRAAAATGEFPIFPFHPTGWCSIRGEGRNHVFFSYKCCQDRQTQCSLWASWQCEKCVHCQTYPFYILLTSVTDPALLKTKKKPAFLNAQT